MHLRIAARSAVLGLTATLLAGCATFHPLPLDTGRGPHVADIKVPAASMPIPVLRTYTFDPANGLNVTEVAMLAVANNPQLKVERDKANVAHAQAYAAGLLPDPQLSYARDYPTSNQPGTTVAFTGGLSFDLGSLITRSARVGAARASEHEIDLNLLWAEWQTIANARTQFDRVHFERALVARLKREQAALAPLQSAIKHALHAGDIDYQSAATGLNAASSVADQLAIAERQLNLDEHNLHDLLGLDAAVPLDLTGPPFSVDPIQARVRAAIINMPKRRPDLLALKAGYHSQNEKLREAILAQFPSITVGFTRARDNSNIYSSGFTIGLSLPLFNGNRGNIAVQRATRQQLHDEYSARLLTDRNDVQRLLSDLTSDRTQRKALTAHAAQLAQARDAAQTNYLAGRLDWPTYLAIRTDSLAADSALLTLDQNTHETAIALDALVGNWPDASNAKANERK